LHARSKTALFWRFSRHTNWAAVNVQSVTTIRAQVRVIHAQRRGGFAILPNALAELLCRGDELGAVDSAFFVHAVSADLATLFAALVAVEESAQGGKRTVELVAVGIRHREDVVEPLVREIGIDDHRAVDERLELGADRVEINGRGEDDDVRRHHLVDDLLRIVLDRALAGLLAGVAARAVADLECGDAHLFDFVPRRLRAIGKCVAKDVRVPSLAR